MASEIESLKARLQAANTAASGYQRAQRDAEDARDRVQRELAALRSRQSQQLNAQWNQCIWNKRNQQEPLLLLLVLLALVPDLY